MSQQQNTAAKQATAGALGSGNSLVGAYIFSSATIDYKAVLEMYIANKEAQNEWAKAQASQTMQQQNYIDKLADATKQATIEQADNLSLQGIESFGGIATPAGSLIGAGVGIAATRTESGINTKMGTIHADLTADAPAPGAKVTFQNRFTDPTMGVGEPITDPRTGRVRPATANDIARAAKINELKASLQDEGKIARLFKGADGKIVERPANGYKEHVLSSDPNIMVDGNGITVKDVLEVCNQDEVEKIHRKVGKAYHKSSTDLNNANSRAQIWVQLASGLGQATTGIVQGVYKMKEAGNTEEQAQQQYLQTIYTGAKDQAGNTISAESQAKDKGAKGASDDVWSTIRTLQQADKSALSA